MIFYFVYEFNSLIGSLLNTVSEVSYTSTSIGTSPIERFPLDVYMLKTSRIFCTLDCCKETLLNDVDVNPLVFGISFPFWWRSNFPLFFLGAWIDCQFIGVCVPLVVQNQIVGIDVNEHFYELQQPPPPYFEAQPLRVADLIRSLDPTFHHHQNPLQVISLAIQMDGMKTFAKKMMQFFHLLSPCLQDQGWLPCTFSPKT